MWTWWGSLEGVTKVKDALELLVLIAGCVTAVGAIGVWVVGQRASTLQEIRDSELQHTAAKAEQELEQLEERTRPRGLTKVQLEELRERLRAIPVKIPIEIVTQDHSFPLTEASEAFAGKLTALFEDLEWEVSVKRSRAVPGPVPTSKYCSRSG